MSDQVRQRWKYAVELGPQIEDSGAHILRLARELHLGGRMRRYESSLQLEVEGEPAALRAFDERLKRTLSLARSQLETMSREDLPPKGEFEFEIVVADVEGMYSAPFSPDRALCSECLKELFEPANRRYRYPFTACGECGPRYSITRKPPYTRDTTSMAPFPLCDNCRREYEDPSGRRHHAPLISCPDCGPCYWIEPAPKSKSAADVVYEAAKLLKQGHILAIKGTGGFHLACLADDDALVQRLRRRVQRRTKPMAVMVPDLDWARRVCHLNPLARGKLKDPSAPIVLAPKKHPEVLAPSVAPDSPDYGLTLPSTPFRHLLMSALQQPLIVTAAKFAGETIVASNEEARTRLRDVADYMVLHDREIMMPCEDTVMRVQGDDLVTTRRSWGQAPRPLVLDHEIPSILALGAIHRGTLALGFGRWIVLSQHLGRLDSPAVEILFRQTLEHLTRLHDFTPSALAYDLHPESLGQRLCKEMGLPSIGVQHHHAHVASVMAEHNLQGPVLGLALDRAGWGEDGTLWGSEFLVGNAHEVERVAHLPYFPLPGGKSAFTHPWRSAAGLLWELKGKDTAKAWLEVSAPDPVAAETTLSLLRENLSCPRACGLGAVYDALAAILGILSNQSFDGQAPMSLERLAGVPHEVDETGLPDPDAEAPEYFRAVIEHLLLKPFNSRQLAAAGAWTQAAVARWIAQRAVRVAQEHQLGTVVASGGCLVNAWLRQELRTRLARAGLRFFTNAAIPPNDGGLPVGQIQVAAARLAGA